MPPRIFFVDVFAARPFSGNPLAVVLDADTFSARSMQRIAAEINYSDTAFVMAPSGGAYPVRIFTPAREIGFGGHPLLGAAWVIRRHLMPDAAEPLELDTPVGRIPIRIEMDDAGEVVWLRAPAVRLGPRCAAEAAAAALGITAADIDPRTPVQQCSAGVSALLVPLRSLDALQRCRLDLAAFAPLAGAGFAPLVYVFCPETRHAGNDYSARFFFDAFGVREDPATGNAAAFLGHYLLAHRLQGRDDLSLRIEQGHAMGRPSLVLVRAEVERDHISTSIGGSVFPTLEGRLLWRESTVPEESC